MAPDGQQPNFNSKLQDLIDKQEIQEALMRYCRGMDRSDAALALSAFHPDAMDNHTGFDAGVYERIPRVTELARTAVKHNQHNITNHYIEVNGDKASSEAYLVAFHRVPYKDGWIDWTLGARYLDKFERRNGEWRIAHRTVVHDWSTSTPVLPHPEGLMQATYLEKSHQGKRSKDDLSYTMFKDWG
jgi:hypothetical protein